MLTNFDLESLCQKYHIPLCGIYMKDQLPESVKDGNYIINLQSSNGGKNKGTHWTALIVHGSDALFYDPFGACPSIDVRRFVKKRLHCHLGYNNWIIQDIHSSNCGWYCLSFLKNVDAKHLYSSANVYLNQFLHDTKKNDDVLKVCF